MQDFLSWMINEANSFLDIAPKVGDIIYFGIHNLHKYNKMNSDLPLMSLYPSDTAINVSNMTTPILDVDVINHQVIVQPTKTPFNMGYRSKYLNSKDKGGYNRIPVENLQNVTFLFENPQRNIWVVISDNNYQKNLIRNLRKFSRNQT